MAKRQGIKRVDSSEVMGEGSYVEFSPVMYEDAKNASIQRDESDNTKNAELVIDLIVGALREWDWVDFDGKPLPLPKTGAELEKILTVTEVQFLTREMVGNVERQKN